MKKAFFIPATLFALLPILLAAQTDSLPTTKESTVHILTAEEVGQFYIDAFSAFDKHLGTDTQAIATTNCPNSDTDSCNIKLERMITNEISVTLQEKNRPTKQVMLSENGFVSYTVFGLPSTTPTNPDNAATSGTAFEKLILAALDVFGLGK